MLKSKFKKMLPVLMQMFACPDCGKRLSSTTGGLSCVRCGKRYLIADGKFYFRDMPGRIRKWSKASMALIGIKKKRSGHMPFGLPNDLEGFARPSIEHIGGPRISQLPSQLALARNARILYLGSGGDAYDGFINLDYFPYKNVDVVADIHRLPFRAATMDCVISNSVFEHLQDPNLAFTEACRVVRKGGFFYFCVPFMSPRHHQIDFWRWTLQGIASLAEKSKMKVLDYGASRGFAYALAPYIGAVSELPLKRKLRSYLKTNAKSMINFFSELDLVLDHKHPLRMAFASTLFVLMRK